MTKLTSKLVSNLEFVLLISSLIFSLNASAEIIDTIEVKKDANGDVDAVIKFLVPIQKIRYAPSKKSRFLEVYFNILDSVPPDQWQNYESRRSPPNDLISSFTVSTRDLNLGPKVQIQFDREVEYVVQSGRSGKSIVLHLKNIGIEAPPPLEMTGSVIPSKIGIKDGLPPFPVITLPAPKSKSKVPQEELPSLDEIILAANEHAALQMAKGEEYLLAEQNFAAISAFNNTLNLPSNKYTEDAQLWIAIAREKAGQTPKAIVEYDTYLKLYPNATYNKWAKERLSKLRTTQAPSSAVKARPVANEQTTPFQTINYGSLSTFYYTGASQSSTVSTVGGIQTSSSLSNTDQSALFTNVIASSRTFNNEYDTRIVFQDMYAKNFLRSSLDRNRLNAAYAEVKNRISDYSVKVGRQSAYGGGVLGRFDGISAGYGITPDFRINVVGGQLADLNVGSQPKFTGASIDFGTKSTFGGSLYYITQTVDGLLDREAIGILTRYYSLGKSVFAMVDYDKQFNKMNMFTMQGTFAINDDIDTNFLVDHRRSPSLSLRNAVNGTNVTVPTLLDNGFTIDDLLLLAEQRTPTSDMAQIGISNRLNERWQMGTDVSLSNTSALQESGTMNPDFTVGLEGFVPATPSTGDAWTLAERLMGTNVITSNDLTMFSISLSKSEQIVGRQFLIHNHAILKEKWTMDTTLRLFQQTDVNGGNAISFSPTLRAGYKMSISTSLEGELGADWSKNTPNDSQSTVTIREYMAIGFRWDF